MGIQAPSAPGPQPHIPTKQTAIVQDASGQPTIVHDSPVPPLRPGTVLVKTVAVALNPSDFKMGSAFPSTGAVVGMDFAGYVVATMPSETASGAQNGIRVGDAVCGIVHGSNPADHESGSFAEYVLAPADLVLKVPPSFPLEAAATLGCALLTSCIALWSALGIAATPQAPAEEAVPVLVYGGSTASGTMAVQLLRLSGLDPVVVCSARHFALAKSYGASAAFDYTSPNVAQDIKTHTRGRLRHALDCITDPASTACCYAAIGRPGGRYACLEACPAAWRTREAVKAEFVMSLEGLGMPVALEGEYGRPASAEKRALTVRLFGQFQKLLDKGLLKPHPIRLVNGGFEGILDGLSQLRSGSVSGEKLVVFLQ